MSPHTDCGPLGVAWLRLLEALMQSPWSYMERITYTTVMSSVGARWEGGKEFEHTFPLTN